MHATDYTWCDRIDALAMKRHTRARHFEPLYGPGYAVAHRRALTLAEAARTVEDCRSLFRTATAPLFMPLPPGASLSPEYTAALSTEDLQRIVRREAHPFEFCVGDR